MIPTIACTLIVAGVYCAARDTDKSRTESAITALAWPVSIGLFFAVALLLADRKPVTLSDSKPVRRLRVVQGGKR
jgi:hypothetical protein